MNKILRRSLSAAVLVLVLAPLAAASYTPRLGLNKPADGTLNWGGILRGNYDIMDASAAALSQDNTFVASNTFTAPVLLSSDTQITAPSGLTVSGAGGLTTTSGTFSGAISAASLSGTLPAADVSGAVAQASTAAYAVGAGTAAALGATPTTCGTGQAARGIDANGNAAGCFTPTGSGDMSKSADNNMTAGSAINFVAGSTFTASRAYTDIDAFLSSAAFTAASSVSFGLTPPDAASSATITCKASAQWNTTAGSLHMTFNGDSTSGHYYDSGVGQVQGVGVQSMAVTGGTYFQLDRASVLANTPYGITFTFVNSAAQRTMGEFQSGMVNNASQYESESGTIMYNTTGWPTYGTLTSSAGTMTGLIRCTYNAY